MYTPKAYIDAYWPDRAFNDSTTHLNHIASAAVRPHLKAFFWGMVIPQCMRHSEIV